MKKIILLAVLFMGFISNASAQDDQPLQNPAPKFFVTPALDAPGLLYFAITTLLGLLGIVTILFIIIGGYQYVVSGANEELAEKGKKTLKNAIIGLIIAILSWVIVSTIYNQLRDPIPSRRINIPPNAVPNTGPPPLPSSTNPNVQPISPPNVTPN